MKLLLDSLHNLHKFITLYKESSITFIDNIYVNSDDMDWSTLSTTDKVNYCQFYKR